MRLKGPILVLAILLLVCAGSGARPPFDGYRLLPPPEPGEWRATHDEKEQSFESFAASRHLKLTEERRIIRIVPIGQLSQELSSLVFYLESFYPGVKVEVAPVRPVPAETRTRNGKLSSDDLLGVLNDRVRSRDYVVLGLTPQDIYEETISCCHPLFGEALYGDRRALASTARLNTGDRDLYRARLFKLATHEINHAIGMRHCATYRCVMNGSSSLKEADRRPPYLCPQDLAKLRHALGFGRRSVIF